MAIQKADQERIEAVLATSTGLPTMPGVAIKIIDLLNEDEVDVDALSRTIQRDPALAAKMLRVANSPIYGSSRGVESLKQAVIRLGLRSTQSLALSFSLISSLKQQSSGALDYTTYWRRCLLSASAGRSLAKRVMPGHEEAVFLASLMQDLGMLVLDKAVPELYSSLGERQYGHARIEAYELTQIETSHTQVGGWMLQEWGFSERMQQAVSYSHIPLALPEGDHTFVRCVALSALTADVLERPQDGFGELTKVAGQWLNMTGQHMAEIMDELGQSIPALERIFDTRLLDPDKLAMISELALERLAVIRRRSVA
uniref:Predicted signal transduction protein n=1 Tax=uncultured gamma proteobacterium HF4000_36I10 TaxID=710989 RepID=E0XWG5_9GAMM|nr:predicted signal transduction protein [uncultured gamma proteobacterium HF4000_36I10]